MSKKRLNTEKLTRAVEKCSNKKYSPFEDLFVIPPERTEQEKLEDKRAIERFGREFTCLHRNVPPQCEKIDLPLTDAEIEWVCDHVTRYGFGVFHDHFNLTPKQETEIKQLEQEDCTNVQLCDKIRALNAAAREDRI